MKKMSFIALALLCASTAFGQDKRVAMLEPLIKGGDVTKIEKEIILAALETAITGTPGYKAFTRVDVNQITKELSFQESGMVNDAQRQKIGQLSGASLICISQLTAGENIHIKCSLVDVETGEIVNVADQLMEKNEKDIYAGCQTLAATMLGGRKAGNSSPSPSNSSSGTGAAYNPYEIEMVFVEGNDILADFYIGKYEVTQAQWMAIMGYNTLWGPYTPVVNDMRAADYVSWNAAQEFIIKLNARTGKNYRLPTEAEWEYAAREGKNNSDYLYSGSNDFNAVASIGTWNPKPVGQKLPNALGIYDMTGNVSEWCQDCYDKKCTKRTVRGGNLAATKFTNKHLGVTVRLGKKPKTNGWMIGLRIAENK
jgi:hypothetical protein